MISRMHRRLGTAGFIISIVALIAALSGGAYAASGALTGKQKKEVEKIARSVSKPGKPGPTGPTGPTGAPGAKGENGSNGTNGTNGTNGKSVKLVNEEPELCPNEEGFSYEIEGTSDLNEICSATGGAAAALPATLALGETETGTWATDFFTSASFTSISFPVRLSAEIDETHVKVVKEGGTPPAECNDGVAPPPSVEHPEAKPGYLCLFVEAFAADASESTVEIFSPSGGGAGAGATGALLKIEDEAGANNRGFGTWAVTGG